MRSLFFRIFVSFWIATTLISVGFALIYAAQSNDSRWQSWQSLHFDAFRMRVGEELARAEAAGGSDDAQIERALAAIVSREPRVRSFAATAGGAPRADRELPAF